MDMILLRSSLSAKRECLKRLLKTSEILQAHYPAFRLRDCLIPMTLDPEKKIAGLLVPLFALRGRHDLGVGDT